MLKRINKRYLLAIWALLLIYGFFNLHYSWFGLRWTNAHIVREIGLTGYIIYEGGSRIAAALSPPAKIDATPYRTFLNERQKTKNCPTTQPKSYPPKNVIFLQLESIDYATLNATQDGKPVMPFLESLRERTIWFQNASDQTGIGRSADAHILALMSQIPIQHEAIFTRYDLSKTPSLPRLLSSHGYTTRSFEATHGEFWRWKRTTKDSAMTPHLQKRILKKMT